MSDKPTDANIFAKACIRVNSVFNFNTLNNIRILFIGDFDIEVIISDANIVYKVNIGQNFDLVSGNFGVVGIVVVVKLSNNKAASLIADAILFDPQAVQLVARFSGDNLEMEKDWEMMSEFDKDEIIRKKIIREL